jgi:hypothetical protein
MYIIGGGMGMLKYKHLRLDQGKIEKAKRILKAKTETEAMDKALERIIQEERERLRRRNLMKRIIQLRNSLGKIREGSAEWVRLARKERILSV